MHSFRLRESIQWIFNGLQTKILNHDESDEFGTFVFRTTGFNSLRTLAARLSSYHAASKASCLVYH